MTLEPAEYYDLRYDHRNSSQVVFLKHKTRDVFLPIWIGDFEAAQLSV